MRTFFLNCSQTNKRKSHTEIHSRLSECFTITTLLLRLEWSKSEEIVDEWFKGLNVSYSWDRWDIINGLPCPNQLRLGGTPLNNSLVAMRKMLPEFKSAYQLEKMILTVITDGFSHDSNLLRLNREEREEMWENEKEVKATMEGSDDYWKRVDQQIFITDPYSKKQYPYVVPAKNDYYSRGYPTEWNKTANLLDWLQKETGVTVTGYFALEQKRDFYSLLNSCDDLRKHVEKEFDTMTVTEKLGVKSEKKVWLSMLTVTVNCS